MSTEPCGSLPVVHLNVSAHFCEHHMAYSANVGIHRQVDGEQFETILERHATFGPFDSWSDVAEWLIDHLRDPGPPPGVTLGCPEVSRWDL